MTVGGLMVRLWPRVAFQALITAWKGRGHRKILLRLICVDLLSVEVRILRQYLGLCLFVDVLFNLI